MSSTTPFFVSPPLTSTRRVENQRRHRLQFLRERDQLDPLLPAARPLPAGHAPQPELSPVRLLLRHPLRHLGAGHASRHCPPAAPPGLLPRVAAPAHPTRPGRQPQLGQTPRSRPRGHARQRAQQDQLSQQRQTEALAENAERSARNIAPWNALRAAQITSHGELQLVARDTPHWNNPRARHLTPKQRIHILRRDGYRCQCPGCPNQLYLHVHHLTYYCQNGTTTPDNLLTLCASCHRNLHNGHLHIHGNAPGNLTFLDPQGRNLGQQHKLEVAEWLDWFLGWPGSQDDSHRARAQGRALQLTG